VPVRADASAWQPGTTATVTASLARVPAGKWHVALAMPAAERTTAQDPAFAIQTANVGTWNARTGVNDLDQVVTVGR
jgi:hypothetical protein